MSVPQAKCLIKILEIGPVDYYEDYSLDCNKATDYLLSLQHTRLWEEYLKYEQQIEEIEKNIHEEVKYGYSRRNF